MPVLITIKGMIKEVLSLLLWAYKLEQLRVSNLKTSSKVKMHMF